MITAIYLAHNRLEFTKRTFLPFLEQVSSDLVTKVIVYDDNSTDGTSDYLMSKMIGLPDKFTYKRSSYNSSWKQINETYPIADKYILKIDNDILIPDGYVQTLFDVMQANDKIGFLGIREALACYIDKSLTINKANNIGGVGLFRTHEIRKLGGIREPDFEHEKRFFGFTDLQNRSSLMKCWLEGRVLDLSKEMRDNQTKYIIENWTR